MGGSIINLLVPVSLVSMCLWVCMHAHSCLTLCDPMDSRFLRPWDFLGKNAGVGCHILLEGIFPTQGLNPCLLNWQTDSLPLSHQHTFNFSHLIGVSVSAKQLKDIVINIPGRIRTCPKAALLFLLTVSPLSHLLRFLISDC